MVETETVKNVTEHTDPAQRAEHQRRTYARRVARGKLGSGRVSVA